MVNNLAKLPIFDLPLDSTLPDKPYYDSYTKYRVIQKNTIFGHIYLTNFETNIQAAQEPLKNFISSLSITLPYVELFGVTDGHFATR